MKCCNLLLRYVNYIIKRVYKIYKHDLYKWYPTGSGSQGSYATSISISYNDNISFTLIRDRINLKVYFRDRRILKLLNGDEYTDDVLLIRDIKNELMNL